MINHQAIRRGVLAVLLVLLALLPAGLAEQEKLPVTSLDMLSQPGIVIAVQDLTKMGDIIRSRTYEAFFPLIAVTIIYFLLEGLTGLLVRRISFTFDPKRRKPEDILKGITIRQETGKPNQ